MRHHDGTVHFSDLKLFARSPAHYRHALDAKREITRAMRVGTAVDRIVFGQELPPVWDGRRQGHAWEQFATAWGEENVITMTEMADGEAIAAAVRQNELAMRYLTGRHQVPMTWEFLDLPCSTRGIDCVGDGWISDLKITHDAEPERLQRHARRMLWHAQLAWYREGAKQMGIPARECYLVCVEAAPPHPVIVLRMTERTLEDGDRCVRLWCEQLRACEAAAVWPGYAQSVVDMDLEQWSGLVGLEEEAVDA